MLERPTPLLVVAAPRARRPRVRDPRAGGRARAGGAARAARARRRSSAAASVRRSRGSAGCTGSSAGAAAAVLAFQLAVGRSCSAPTRPSATRRTTSARRSGTCGGTSAELSLYVLVIPLAATIVLVARARSLDARLQAFLAATVSLTVCVVPVVAAFASEFSDRIEERNLFYVAPLFCIALLAWVERGAPRPRVLAAAAAAVSALLVVAIPFDRFITTSALTDTLMLLPFWSLQDRIGADWIRLAAFGLAAALAAAFLFVPRRYALALPLLVLGLWILAIRPIWWGTHGFERFSRGALFQGIRTADRDWVDQALPPGERGCVPLDRAHRSADGEPERVLQPRRRARVYYVTDPTPGGLPETRVRIDPQTGAGDVLGRRAGSRPVPPRGLVVRARRRAARDGQGVGHHTLARAPAARLRRPGRRPLSERHVVGRDGHVHAAALRVRAGSRSRCRATRASSSSRRPSSRARTGAVVGRVDGRAVRDACVCACPSRRSRGRRECRVVYTRRADGRSGRGHGRCESRPARARRALQPLRLRTGAVRIAFDVSPLSHPLLGIGNYIRVRSAASSRRRRESTRSSRSRRRASAGPGRIRAALAGVDVELRTWPLPFSHAARTAWSGARASGRRAAPRPLRRPPLLGLDVSAAARTACGRRRSTTSSRSITPSGRPRGRARCTAASTGTPPRRATSCS